LLKLRGAILDLADLPECLRQRTREVP
jgi:hypothetical protein